MFTVLIVIIVIALAAVFSVQNALPISVSFLSWKFEASLAVVILLSVLAGMIIGMILLSLIRFKRSAANSKRGPGKDIANHRE